MMRWLSLGGGGGSSGADARLVRKVGAGAGVSESAALPSILACWGLRRVRLFFSGLAVAGFEVVGLGGPGVGRRGV